MIVVDTSVWIDHFRGHDSPEARRLTQALSVDETLCICGLILTEVLQGVRHDTVYRKVKGLLTALVYLPMPQSAYLRAADIYRTARSDGQTVRNSVDCIIAACAIEHQIPLLQRDKDYSTISQYSSLRLLEP